MSNMKYSGVEWLGEIPEDWKVSRYKFYTQNRMGITILSNDLVDTTENIDNIIPVYSATQDDKIFGYVEHANLLLHKGDLVIPARGNSIGCMKIIKDDVATCTQTTICSTNIVNIDNRILYYCSIGLKEYWYKYDGSAIPQITVKQIMENKIPVPTKIEQQKIANFLDKKCSQIDKLTSNQEQQIENLKSYKQSLITETVTKGLNPNVKMKSSGIDWIGEIPNNWDIIKFKQLGTVRNGLTYSPSDLCDKEDGTLILRSSNIKNGQLYYDDNVYVSCDIKEELKVKPGDILICSRNGSKKLIGKNALIDSIDATFGAFMMIFRSEYNSKYIKYILDSSVFQYYLGTFLTATINQLTGANFKNMEVPFVWDKEEQQQIVSYLDDKCSKIDTLIEIKDKKIKNLNEYKKSLIYEYVTGKKEIN